MVRQAHHDSETVTPSAQQSAIVEAARRGESLRVLAFAGTGKTTTLEMVARALPADLRALYIVFNKSQQILAQQRFADLPGIETRTAHSLAYAAVGYAFRDRLESRETSAEAQWLAFLEERGVLAVFAPDPRAAGRAVIGAMRAFIASADARIGVQHVADAETFDAEQIAHLARRLWLSLESNDRLPVTHDVYLKLWQLREPALAYDVVLYDEAQDATPAMLAVVRRQARAQQIFVGDPHQQLYEFRGAVNALGTLDLPAFPLTESRRFGPEIARIANTILSAKGERLRMTGIAASAGRLASGYAAQPDVVLSRTNVGLVHRSLELIDRGLRLFIRGATGSDGLAGNGAGELRALIGAAFDLRSGRPAKHPMLASFATWTELQRAAESEGGESYRPYVRIVEQYASDVPRVLARIRDGTEANEEHADVVMTTVHRFKGEERNIVVLADDFQMFVRMQNDERGRPRPTIDASEANVAYVAVTRAQRELWYGGTENIFKGALALRGLDLPVTPLPTAPSAAAPRRMAAPHVAATKRTSAPKPAPPARAYKEVTPGSRWQHSTYGELTIIDATSQLIVASTSDGDIKSLATLPTYPQLVGRQIVG